MEYEDRNNEARSFYFRDANKFSLITKEKEAELAGRIHHGDKNAFNHMVEANLRLVIDIAKRYQGMGLPLNDLISAGNAGLVKAAEKYQYTGGKFSTYCSTWIKQTILREIHQNFCVETDFLFDSMSDSAKDIYLCDEHENTEKRAMQSFAAEDVYNFLQSSLTKKQRDIIEERFGLRGDGSKSQEEIANERNIRKQAVSKLEKRALKRIRQNRKVENLREYLS